MPLKSKGCNEIQGFRGNCDSQGKLGMCPSLAEPDLGSFPRSNFKMFHVKHNIKIKQSWLQTKSRRQRKSFSMQQFFKNAAEVWASSPHLRSKLDFATLFSCCNCIFETVQFKQSCIMRIKVANSDKATGQLQHAGRQKQGWNPLLPDAKDRFL